MKPYPLEKLLKIRTLRIELALSAVREKQRIKAERVAECKKLKRNIERLLLQRLREQRHLSAAVGASSLADLKRRDERIGFLAERAEQVGTELVAANKALEVANLQLQTALKTYSRACAKRDSLLESRTRWRREQNAIVAGKEEAESEELTMFRFAKLR